MKFLFIIHSYIDFSFFLPLMFLFKENNVLFDVTFLDNFGANYELDDVNWKLFSDYDMGSRIIEHLKKGEILFRKLMNFLPCPVSNNDYYAIITDHVLYKTSPTYKYKILSTFNKQQVKIINFVHTHNIVKSKIATPEIRNHYKLLQDLDNVVVYSDKNYESYLRSCGFKSIFRFPALKFSRWFNENYFVPFCKHIDKKNQNYLLFLDNIFLNQPERERVIEDLKSFSVEQPEIMIYIKKKPRDFKSIITEEMFLDFPNVQFAPTKLSAEQLVYNARWVVSGGHSSAMISSFFFNIPCYLYLPYRSKHVPIELPVLRINSLKEIIYGFKNSDLDYFWEENSLTLTSHEYYNIFERIIEYTET